MTRVFSEKISTRATRRQLEGAVKPVGEIRSSGVAVTLVVHEHKRLGRGIELAMLAEKLKASDCRTGVPGRGAEGLAPSSSSLSSAPS